MSISHVHYNSSECLSIELISRRAVSKCLNAEEKLSKKNRGMHHTITSIDKAALTLERWSVSGPNCLKGLLVV